MRFQNYNVRAPQNGFTLVETLVAITVLLLVIIGPMTVAQKGIQNAYYANDQVTAVFLAQEAIEAIRQLRDESALIAAPVVGGDTWVWYGGIHSTCRSAFTHNNPLLSTGCAFNVASGGFEACSDNNGCALRFNTETGKYTYGTGVSNVTSPFTRKVYVGGAASGSDHVPVTVDVTWDAKIFGNGNNTRTVRLQTWVYDQYQEYEQ